MYINSSITDKKSNISIFNIAPISSYDGPGNRTVVFFQGCTVNCSWCHSPHSQASTSPILYHESRCINCHLCVNACQNQVHSYVDGKHILDRRQCCYCGQCIDACPQSSYYVQASALHLPTTKFTAGSLYQELRPYLRICDGITLSGGEALCQPEGIKELLQLCKQDEIHTALETSGLLPVAIYESVIPYVDTWLFGIRIVTTSLKKLNIKQICKVLDLLSAKNADIIARIPMVPTIYDQIEVLEQLKSIMTFYQIEKIWLNPWNRSYDVYYKASGTELKFFPPTDHEIDLCEKSMRYYFKESGFTLIN